MKSVLFVCTGNICRSPSAEGVFRAFATERSVNLVVDSAGTHGYHVGEHPDERSQRAALQRGIDISDFRARKVSPSDFDKFDYILVMDSSHYASLLAQQPDDCRATVKYMMDFAPNAGALDVPDPYYGGENGFEYVLDLIEIAAEGFFDTLCAGTSHTSHVSPISPVS